MMRSIFLVIGVGFVLIAASARAQAPYQPGIGFAMIGIASGESMRVNALNIGSSASKQASSCPVTLQFLGAQSEVLKQTIVTLRPGAAASMDLSRDAIRAGEGRAEIRAVLLFGYSGGAAPSPEVLQRFDCNIVPSVEVYENRTGRTSVVVTDARPLPSTAIRAQ